MSCIMSGKADPLTTGGGAQELNTNYPMVIWQLKQTGKAYKLRKWVPHELIKILVLNYHLLLLYVTKKPFLIGL